MERKDSKSENNIFITLLVILMAVAVVVAIAGTIARDKAEPSKKAESVTTKSDSKYERQSERRLHDAEEEVTLTDTNNADINVHSDVTTTAEDSSDEVSDSSADEKEVFVEETIPDMNLPVSGEVLKDFSTDVPVFSLTMEDYRTHGGIDIYAKEGTDVLAAADGTVSEIWEDPMMGQCISLSHSGGAVTTYKNLSENLPENIAKGTAVKAGQVIGTVGDTALEEIAEESHLHFEIAVDGKNADPADYLTFPVMNDFSE